MVNPRNQMYLIGHYISFLKKSSCFIDEAIKQCEYFI